MSSKGYTRQSFQYYAYGSGAAGRVEVYRWWQPTDQDWITVAADEATDAELSSWGYIDKTLLAYAYKARTTTGKLGYFALDAPQSSVVPDDHAVTNGYPHTMSVLDVNPTLDTHINGGRRYLGVYGHNECNTDGRPNIFVARTDSLDSAHWETGDDVHFRSATTGTPLGAQDRKPCRWASALVDDAHVDLVVNDAWDESITGQTSLDGLNGTTYGKPVVLVRESGVKNGNPTLFRDPSDGRVYLYWYRYKDGMYEIRVKSSDTFADLVDPEHVNPTDVGDLVARSPLRFAAPQVMSYNGTYYLAVETYEAAGADQPVWRTRVLTAAGPTGPFVEIPGNPVYAPGAACVFQHVVDDTLHAYYCQMTVPGDSSTWTLDHVKGNLLNPT